MTVNLLVEVIHRLKGYLKRHVKHKRPIFLQDRISYSSKTRLWHLLLRSLLTNKHIGTKDEEPSVA